MTFLVTSNVLPAPRSPLCQGLSTLMSDAISIYLPLLSASSLCCSVFHTLKTAGMTLALWTLEISRLLICRMCSDSRNRINLLHSIPVLRILDAISRFNAGRRFKSGPVDHEKLCSDVRYIDLTVTSNDVSYRNFAVTPTN